MTPPPLPPDEEERLAELLNLGVLDSPFEERFDRIVRIAVSSFDVPIALVSLVDAERQWFKACIGLDTRQTDRSVSFCAHALMSDATFVVEDAHEDPRFRENPLVTGPPNIRFYAGRPLHGPGGYRVGTLCVIDDEPRSFSPPELALLDDLAQLVERELHASELARALDAQVRSEQQLRSTQRRLLAILDSAAEGVFGVDTEGRVTFVNPAAARMFDRSQEDLLGEHLHEVAHDRYPDGRPYPWDACPTYTTLREGEPNHVANEVFWRSDHSSFPVEYRSSPIIEDGVVTGAVVTFSDITERREIERLKDEFISVVSHELRTPLTSIRGSLGLLASGALGELPERGTNMLKIAASNTDRLVRLVNDILDLERITSGRAVMDIRDADGAAMISAAIEAVRGAADKAGITLEVDAPDLQLRIDSDRVIQVLVNLLGNAIKFSEPGSTVRLIAEAEDDCFHLRVVDRGRGIPADRLEAIFDRFEQVDATDSRQKGGTGLGLAIAKSIVELHGGSIWAESEVGKGSTFHLRLPLSDVLDTEPARTGAAGHVLVVEDDVDLAHVLAELLEQSDFQVERAAGEVTAVAALRTQLPDAVVLDVQLADGTAHGVLEALRGEPRGGDVPVVVFTVHDLEGPERARLERGPVRILTKGKVPPEALRDALVEMLGQR